MIKSLTCVFKNPN